MNARSLRLLKTTSLCPKLTGVAVIFLCHTLLAQVPGEVTIYPAVELEFQTETGKTYQLQGSSDLTAWSMVGQPHCGVEGSLSVLLSTRTEPKFRFYRLQIAATPCPELERGVVLIGHDDHVMIARNYLGVGSIFPRDSVLPNPNDAVFFTVAVVDGAMPQTRMQIEAIRGKPRGPAAIFLVNSFQVPDPELRSLVVLELQELLRQNQQPAVEAMPVIFDDEADALNRIRLVIADGEPP
jgi:hypothetical protein